jgi:hypothetical protein
LKIEKFSLPTLSYPGKLIVHPYTQTTYLAAYMIFLAYMREVDLSNVVIPIKAN